MANTTGSPALEKDWLDLNARRIQTIQVANASIFMYDWCAGPTFGPFQFEANVQGTPLISSRSSGETRDVIAGWCASPRSFGFDNRRD